MCLCFSYWKRRNSTTEVQTQCHPLTRTRNIGNEAPFDLELSFSGHGLPRKHLRSTDFDRLRRVEGNMLEFSRDSEARARRLIVQRSAEVLFIAHSEGRVHGNLGPGAFHLNHRSITLLDIGLYGLAQQYLDQIKMTPAHNYKARRELRMSIVVPTMAMDVHSWGKTIISLYTNSAFRMSLGKIPLPVKPQEMPQEIWDVVFQCLDEELNIHVDMEQIVAQLATIP
ncbi:hypothetical protein BDQ17DRAFT_1326126 [Cyathus striatus]|nr:hypothetical protein BDQ17DRAFT_1326126 [Cyathus striatus]